MARIELSNIGGGGGTTLSLTTTGTSGAATLAGSVLNIPIYQGQLTLTTTGTSGAATLVGNTLNIPQYSGGGGTPAGSTGEIQYNNAGAFAASSNLAWDNSNVRLNIGAPSSPTGRLNVKGGGATSLTVNARFTNSSNTELFKISDNGLVNINGTINTITPAITGRESILKSQISDAGNDSFFIYNATSVASTFVPSFAGYVDNTVISSLIFTGFCKPSNDVSSFLGLIDFYTANTNSATDPPNGTQTPLVNRNLVTCRNEGTYIFGAEANGNFFIGRQSGSASGRLNVVGANSSGGTNAIRIQNSLLTDLHAIENNGKISYLATNTAAGTTGAQTINRPSGTVNFAAGATSLVVTNSLCTTASIVLPVIRTNDATATIKNVVPAAGSFTINLGAAATAETSVGFFIIN